MATTVTTTTSSVNELFSFYRLKFGRTCFAMLLMMQVVYHVVYIVLRRTLASQATASTPVDVIVSSSACVIYLLLLITSVTCSRYSRAGTLIAACYWLVAVTSLLASPSGGGHVTMVYYVIVTSYAMLPVRRGAHCVALGVITGLVHLAVFTLITALQSTDQLASQVMANVAVLACANAVGLHQRMLTDSRHRRTFTHIRSYIESRVKLENERQQQEQLLLSVLPVHVAVELKNKMLHRLRVSSSESQHQQHSRQQKSAYGRFHDMYVKVHENVSILYADIVNFTTMASDCTAPVLVRMLNELVGKFEQLARASHSTTLLIVQSLAVFSLGGLAFAAQKNDCLRIKMLGDCYYCVSGLPISRPNHARNCVCMALDMINAIRDVREATGVDVNMRIGVHTGFVLSGVVGLHKWQYDVWSDDVVIANHMESTGKPGRVHVSKATLMLLGDEFCVESADGDTRDSYLVERGIETFFIIPQSQTPQLPAYRRSMMRCHVTDDDSRLRFMRMSSYLSSWGADRPFAHLDNANNLANNIALTSVATIKSNMAPLSCFCDFSEVETEQTDETSIKNLLLLMRDTPTEWAWFSQCDVTLGQNLLACHVVFVCLFVLQVTMVTSAWSVSIIVVFVVIFSLVSVVCLADIANARGIGCWYNSRVCRLLAQLSRCSKATISIRLSIILIYCATVCSLPLILLLVATHNKDPLIISFISRMFSSVLCTAMLAQYWPVSCMMALSSVSLFLATSCYVKLTIMIIATVTYNVICYVTSGHVFHADDNSSTQRLLPVGVEVSLCTLMLIITLHCFDRQTEISSKLDFIWRRKFGVEKEEVETMASVNKVLLENILPAHVAEHFLSSQHRQEDLYHETYEAVVVMFASIPKFWDFCRQSAVSRHGIECIRLLNEIICDFDQLLSKPKYSGVEKIKTIGSTYMAAAGLLRCQTQHRKESAERVHQSIVLLADFALAIMSLLDRFNRNSFNYFKLRIGMNHGQAIAGVIGAHKPQYDIWGDTVNVASRMETSGLADHIQCPEWTAESLIAAGYNTQSRGEIRVKGKRDAIKVYLVSRTSPSPAASANAV